MKFLLYFQLVLGFAGSIAAWLLVAPVAGGSFAIGALMTLFNFAILVFGWPRILARKQVALATLAIVSKFAILGWILYLVAHSPAVHLGWFALGLGTVVPSVITAAFKMPTWPSSASSIDDAGLAATVGSSVGSGADSSVV